MDVVYRMSATGVWNQWNGMVEWTTGMEYWNGLGQDLCACIKSIVLYESG